MGITFTIKSILQTTSIKPSQSNTSPTSIIMSDYKPTEHDGLRKDGQPDKRVGTGEFAQGKVDPVEAGKQGGKSTGTTDDSTGSSGTGNSGNSGGSGKGEFAHGKVDPVEAGKKGGSSS